MQKLEITTPGPDGHTHLVYTNTDSGVSAMSPAKDGHVHEIIYDPPREPVQPTPEQPPQIDPMTGMPMIDPATGQPSMGTPATPGDPGKETGSWIVRPAGEDLHEHELVEYKTTPAKSNESDTDILKECMDLWREALKLSEDCKEKGKESEDFYKGKQWKEDIERTLNNLDRAALTINEIAPNIDTLVGYQMEQRTDLKYLPVEGGDQRVADILNITSKKILDSCYFPREETKVFKDICVAGRGIYNVGMSFEGDIQGTPFVERFPWDDCDYGPHEKEDLSDCEFEVKSRMQSLAWLKKSFPKKVKDIEDSFQSYQGQYPDINKGTTGVSGTHMDYKNAKKVDESPQTVDGSLPLVDVARKQFRLAQCSRKVYSEVTVIFNQEENFFFTAYDWKDDDIARASTIPGFQVITQMKTRMRITRFCAGVVLSDENPASLPLHDFYTVPVYGYRQNGEFWGKVEAAKDPQRELNKRRSQAMDTMNRLGAAVYYTEPETFSTPKEKEDFKKKRSRPGSIFEVNDLGRTPKLEEGAQFPAALVQIMQLDQQNLQRLMNVVVEQAGANESGTMFLEKKKGRLTGNQFLFDNASFAKQKLGKILAALIQKYYTPERLLRLLDSQYSKQKFELGGMDYSQYSKEELTELLEEADLLEYDVIVTESAFAPSTRLGIAKVLFELISQGAAIPPEVALQFVDMPADIRKDVTDKLAAQADATAQSETASQNSEITKTLVAKGDYTVSPEKAQELGLVPTGANPPLANSERAPNNVDTTQTDEYANNLASSLAG